MPKAVTLIQVELQSGDTRRVCWVESRVKPGDEITLKNEDPGRTWKVTWASDTRKHLDDIHKDWKAGGL